MSRQSITFNPKNDTWLNEQVESQEYSSKSEVVNDLIRRARREEEAQALLAAKLMRAEDGGMSDRSPEQIRQEAKKRLKQDD